MAVNHIWSRHFGRGIVETTENLGRNGARPTHPELLDWLAMELMENGWRMKRIHRLIVTSNTYRMSSVSPASPSEQADPDIPFEETMRRLLRRLLERHADHPRLQRALTEEVPQPKHIRARNRRTDREYTRRVAEVLRRRPDVHVGNVEAAAHVLVVSIGALARWLAHEPPDDVDREACLEEIVRLLGGYVRR